jgi:hypothetical protein
MSPSDYVDNYLSFDVWLGDTFTRAGVRNYLQSGLGAQSTNAGDAYRKLTAALAARLKLRGALPGVFTVEGDQYVSRSLWRVYNGKGAPDEIQSALWLASLCGLVDFSTVNNYTDSCLGVDCGGFVANYWGIGHPTPTDQNPNGATGFKPRTIWETNRNLRRDQSTSICVGDAAVFFKDVIQDNPDLAARQKADGGYDTSSGSQAFHIGVVSSVSCQPGAGTVTLEIAESSGARAQSGGNGVNVRSLGTVAAKVANGLVFCPDGSNRIYFVGCRGTPSPSVANTFGA